VLLAEQAEADTAAKHKTDINSAPGEDFDRDAFNILEAVRHGNLRMVRAIVEHQTSEVGTEHILATMTAWLALALRAMPEEYAEHFVWHLRNISQLSADYRSLLAALNETP
jgi:hypothetical protein